MRFRVVSAAFLAAICMIAWLKLGIAADAYSEESHRVVFTKKYLTLRVFFVNPALTESDVPALNLWPESKKKELALYCFYRFGVESELQDSLEACAQRPFLSGRWLTDWRVGLQ